MVKIFSFCCQGIAEKNGFECAQGTVESRRISQMHLVKLGVNKGEKYMSDIQLGCLIYGNEIFEHVSTLICGRILGISWTLSLQAQG